MGPYRAAVDPDVQPDRSVGRCSAAWHKRAINARRLPAPLYPTTECNEARKCMPHSRFHATVNAHLFSSARSSHHVRISESLDTLAELHLTI